MSDERARIGIIGGSGLYDLPGARLLDEIRLETPWGAPSDAVMLMEIEGIPVAFLPRHGRGHRVLPSEVNSRANLCALKMLGVRDVLAFSAVGSLQEELAPLDFVVPTQLIDRTRHRPDTYFGDGIVGHVSFADPFTPAFSRLCVDAIRAEGLPGGQTEASLVCMEGPLFSTRAESELYRSWGAGLINMSAVPESKLAREAELAYALVCMVTDYDCWRDGEDDVDIQMVIENLGKNANNARRLLTKLVPRIASELDVPEAYEACKFAIITPPEQRSPEAVERLRVLLPHYFL